MELMKNNQRVFEMGSRQFEFVKTLNSNHFKRNLLNYNKLVTYQYQFSACERIMQEAVQELIIR